MSVVRVKSSDSLATVFELESEVAHLSRHIREQLAAVDDPGSTIIVLPTVSTNILALVVDYCIRWVKDPAPADDDYDYEKRHQWEGEYLEALDSEGQVTLLDLILAANQLGIEPLLARTCQHTARLIKGKSTEEIRRTFNIKNDFTPEEEERVVRENAWCSLEEH